MLQGYKAQP